MEIFGGFMVMMSIIGLFLAVVWLIMPFVVFAIKGKQDRSLELLEIMEKRLIAIEGKLTQPLSDLTAHMAPAAPQSEDAPPPTDHCIQPPTVPFT